MFSEGGDSILPFNQSTNALRDAAIDLGDSTRRFKDLYLSSAIRGVNYDIYTEGSGSLYQTTGYLRFANGNTETARIDSSGNVLVGQTSIGDYTTTAGISLRASGFSTHTRDDGDVLLLNRLTSDGSILQFRKDNIPVGSIGTRANYIKIGRGDTNLLFNSASDAVTPEG